MNTFCELKTEMENIWQICTGEPTFMVDITQQLQLILHLRDILNTVLQEAITN